MKTTTSFALLSASLTTVLCCSLLALSTTAATPTVEWIEQLGTSDHDQSYSVSADGFGNVYISGYTRGDLGGGGGDNAGLYDAFVSKYDTSGTLLWTEQLGTTADDGSLGVSADGLGNV